MIFIEDNGRGMEQPQVEEMNRMFRVPPSQVSDRGEDVLNESIGLMNVNSRLQLKFGAEYGISVASKTNEGTCVSLRMPINGRKGERTDVFLNDC
ncbi:sensor histidine kinase [Caproicibacter fermentans]|uniref:sensor histidine kinase n=1 Tax=Caproicibacter fermentans TaxID=2576756 RepID=UPI00226B3959|nr:ATP-binding protein [Caproicibacter fermentans]